MLHRFSTITIALAAAGVFGTGSAFADCAENLTRIQTALPSASDDVRATVTGLVSTAEKRAKEKDSAGCAEATTEALKLLGLASLPPITLSTPVPGVDRQPHPPAPPAASASGDGAKATPSASAPDAATKPKQTDTKDDAQAGAPASPPSGQTTPSTAQDKASTDQAASDQTASKDWYLVTSALLGQHVTAQDEPGTSIGVIKALAIDGPTGQAVLALIETGGFLGIGSELVAVPFSAIRFHGRWDRPEVQAKSEIVQSAPRVTADNVTNLLADPGWRKELGDHFGVHAAATAAPATSTSSDGAPASAPAAKAKQTAATTQPDAQSADASAGHAYVKTVCAACHTFDVNGGTRVGPNLHDVFDRKIAGVSGYSYSSGLKSHGGVWDAANLDAFLQSPQHFAPHTMMTFAGIPSSKQRADVIAYLKTLGSADGDQK